MTDLFPMYPLFHFKIVLRNLLFLALIVKFIINSILISVYPKKSWLEIKINVYFQFVVDSKSFLNDQKTKLNVLVVNTSNAVVFM